MPKTKMTIPLTAFYLIHYILKYCTYNDTMSFLGIERMVVKVGLDDFKRSKLGIGSGWYGRSVAKKLRRVWL